MQMKNNKRDKLGRFIKGGVHYSMSDIQKQKVILAHLGKKHTSETRLKMSQSAKTAYKEGRRVGSFLGKKMHPNTKKALIESHLGKSSWNKNKSFSFESRKKMSIAKQDISEKEWKGFKGLRGYSLNFINNFKNKIRNRDNQICMNCGIHREKLKEALQIHHINYDKKLSIFENCISLCRSCHMKTLFNRSYWIQLFQEKLSKYYGYKYSNDGKVILQLNNKEVFSILG